MNTGNAILFIILVVIAVFVFVWFKRKFKTLTLPCVFFVSGQVKSGKTLLSVHLAIKEYKRALRGFKIRKFLVKVLLPLKYAKTFARVDKYLKSLSTDDVVNLEDYDDIDELKDYFPPMLYSNIPLAKVRFNPLTIDIINREVRIPNKSVVLIDEVSLFADSQLFKSKHLNNKLMAFYKLYGHYSHGGKLIIDSQSISDNHYSVKRCMGSYLYIYDRIKIPFFTIMKVRQLAYSDDNSISNNFNEDIELSMRLVLILNTTYNKYDCYCYSCFTDYKKLNVDYTNEVKGLRDNLKCYNIVTLNAFVEELNEELRKYLNGEIVDTTYVDEEGVVHREGEEESNEEN